MKKEPILFVNHKAQKCGVYEYGHAIGNVLIQSTKYLFIYCEVDNWEEFYALIKKIKPKIIIYNFYLSTMGWIIENKGLFINSHKIKAVQISIIHEVTQEIADNSTNIIFDYFIAADPTLMLKNPIVYKTGRLIPRYKNTQSKNKILNVGSFGFATSGKGFIRIIEIVQEEFDEAIINFNISFAKFGDENGDNARKIAEDARGKLKKKGIILNISHEHLTHEELLKFLAKNDLNVFLYEYQENRGISSATDWALAVNRPFAITKSSMFRHLFDCYPSICVEDSSLKTIISNGTECIERLYEEWSPENLLWDYERIIDDVFRQNQSRKSRYPIQKKLNYFFHTHNLNQNKTFLLNKQWINNNSQIIFDGFVNKNYHAIDTTENDLNIILDSKVREKYKSALEFIENVAPATYAKKIPEANIQQAFVFNTAYQLSISNKQSIKILSVGAFEDTAAIVLQKLGFHIIFIDPIINYDLSTYITKPSVRRHSFDIIISTSVIEHVKDDEKFIKDINYLLKVGGYGILTCDFKDDYKVGDDIPEEDCRLYTRKDLNERLLKNNQNCQIIGTPHWECNNYEFFYQNKHRYTFASFVFKKVSNELT